MRQTQKGEAKLSHINYFVKNEALSEELKNIISMIT